MSHIKKFSYPDISRRWLLVLALFITFSINAFIISEIIIDLKQYLPYYPVIQALMIFSMTALFAGNFAGRLLFSAITNQRIVILTSSAIFAVFSVFFFTAKFLKPELFSIINIYIADKYFIILLSAAPSFLSGILNSYYLKISSGDFIDEKNLLPSYIITFPLALGTGFVTAYLVHFYTQPGLIYSLLVSLIALTLPVILFLIKIPFSPEQLYSQNFYEDENITDSPIVQRDDLFFTYINFSYIMVYIVLGFILFVKFYGHTYYNVFLYIIATLFFSLSGSFLEENKKRHSGMFTVKCYILFFSFYIYLFFICLMAKPASTQGWLFPQYLF